MCIEPFSFSFFSSYNGLTVKEVEFIKAINKVWMTDKAKHIPTFHRDVSSSSLFFFTFSN